jgi:hypothetical protein
MIIMQLELAGAGATAQPLAQVRPAVGTSV